MRFLLLLLPLLFACARSTAPTPAAPTTAAPLPLIFDTDANNELDDQHALAYLFMNDSVFDVKAITTNATRNGGNIEEHTAEAARIMTLFGVRERYPLIDGANQDFATIKPYLNDDFGYDGQEAVERIISEARKDHGQPLVLVPVGKLTNVALALAKAPDIADRVRVVWLGSNYPEPGEYNQDNDEAALNYILDTDVPFEIVTVRYGKMTGSDAVRIDSAEVRQLLAGKGRRVVTPITGRHGGTFDRFGDYAVNLFDHVEAYHGDPPSRAMFDMVALAVLKNPDWGERRSVPAPRLAQDKWEERPDNPRTVVLWENFDEPGILGDFFAGLEQQR